MKIRNWSDWAIAIITVICSAVLFLALAAALSGVFIGRPSKTVEADFADVTGVGVHSEVRFAGAPAGVVARVRILTAEERLASPTPGATVRLTLALNDHVPPLLQGTRASIASDTILSEKFVLLRPGEPTADPLKPGAILSGTGPVTLDEFLRRADSLLAAAGGLMGNGSSSLYDTLTSVLHETRELLAHARDVVAEVRALVADVQPVPSEIRAVTGGLRLATEDARAMLREIRPGVRETISRLEAAARSLEQLGARGAHFVSANEKEAAQLLDDLRGTAQNAKIAATWLRIWVASLARHPSQLLWGTRRPPTLPTEQEILQSPEPIPAP